MSNRVLLAVCAALTATVFSTPAVGQPLHARPGSILIFPLFNSTEGNNTFISVTNTNQSEVACGNGFREGDVEIHYVYTDGGSCREFDRSEDLTPADQLCVFAREHNVEAEVGFLTVEARDPESGLPIDFDHLIGSAIVVNSEFDFEWSYTPYAFEGLPGDDLMGQDRGAGGFDTCGRAFTDDPGSPDFTSIDFDGWEYSTFPEFVYIDQFFGEGTPESFPSVTFSNRLYLMSTTTTATQVKLLGWNNNERRFSRTFSFECWLDTSLGDLTSAVTQENLRRNGNSGELAAVGTGWIQLTTDTPGSALLGVLVQRSDLPRGSFTGGRELQFEGRRVTSLPRFN